MALIRKKKTEKDDTPEAVQDLFDRRHRSRIDQDFRKARPAFIRAGILTAAILVIAAYFLMPVSRIREIRITGNDYLSADYIRSLSRVSANGWYYLTVPSFVKSRVEDDPFVESCKVSLEAGNTIRIDVKEKKPVGYRYDESPVILFTDSSAADLKSDYLDIIARIPMISGFTDDEQTRLLCKAFVDIDQSVIEDMSEISQYPLSYDEETIRVLMRSGGYFIANYFSLHKIKYYNDVYSQMRDKSMCIYAGDNNATVFSMACPWVSKTAEAEYWKDAEGNLILNEKGEQIIVHYYYLKDGSQALDGSGNPIRIPIDEKGNEVRDEEFDAHYEAGYYSSGVLQIPEGAAEIRTPGLGNA